MIFLQGWYQDHPGTNRLPPIRTGNLLSNDWYELHCQTIKAASTRSAAPAFLALCQERLLPADATEDQQLCDLVVALVNIYDTFYSEPMFMSNEAIRSIRQLLEEFGTLFMHMREDARARGELSWSIKPNVRTMQHLATMCHIINPRHCPNYAE